MWGTMALVGLQSYDQNSSRLTGVFAHKCPLPENTGADFQTTLPFAKEVCNDDLPRSTAHQVVLTGLHPCESR